LKEVGLILVARRENELTRVADAINNDYYSTLIIPPDITKRENVEKILQETKTKFNRISC
jgi:short-subunit dehydrogenase